MKRQVFIYSAFIILLTVFLSMGTRAQNCSDTSFKKLYSSPNAILTNKQYSVNKYDGNSLLAGNYYDTLNNDTALYVIKLSSFGEVIWSKKIFISNTLIQNFKLVELDNGNIIISIFYTDFEEKIKLLKLNHLGDLLWAKDLVMQNFKYLSDLNTYSYNNNIYISFNGTGADGSDFVYWNTTLIKIDENANVQWSKFYSNINGMSFFSIPAGLIKSGDSLIVLGRQPILPYYQPSYDSLTEQSYYSMKVSDVNGALGKSVNYSLPRDLWGINNGAAIYGGANNFYLKITQTKNNQYFFNSHLSKLPTDNKGRSYKVRFDENLNFYEGRLYTIDTSATRTQSLIDVDEEGNTNIITSNRSVNGGNSSSYFGKFDINNNVIRQKKIYHANETVYAATKNSFGRKKQYINLAYQNIKNGASYLQILQLSNEEQNNGCFGKDTNFISTSPYNITPFKSPFFEKAFDIDASMIDENNVTVSNMVITKEDVCDQISLCTDIKIHGPTAIVCNLNQEYIYKASLNNTCYKHVFWQIDSSVISELTPIDDTTVSIKFKANFQGYLYASVNSCMDLKDSILLVVYNTPANINLGSDTSVCRGQQIMLDAKPGFKDYSWQDGSSNSYLLANESGKYFVQATDYCGNIFSDTIKIIINEPSTIDIGRDTSFCFGESIMLKAGNNFESYMWNNGQTSSEIKVTGVGEYFVLVKNNNGCTSTDTMSVIEVYTLPDFSLNKKSILCRQQNDTIFAAPNFTTYLWQDGSSKYFYPVLEAGNIKLTVTNENGCIARDSLAISKIVNSPSDFLDDYLTICEDETVVLKPISTFAEYLWNNGSKMPTIQATPGNYWLIVKDMNGCIGVDSLNVTSKDCTPIFFVPNAFTPNNDGLNDIFKPVISGNIEEYIFTIYDRYGQQIFSTKKINEGWNGTIKGKPQNTGTFIWTCSYKFKGLIKESKKGSIVLIR